MGHRVIGVDRDEHKVRNVLDGKAPFYEPGLEDLVKKGAASGLLTACTSAAEAITEADIALICVGTPSQSNGDLGLDQLGRILAEIAALLTGRQKSLIVAIRSTVFPGTCDDFVIPALGGLTDQLAVVSNPEFLREGTAVRDFIEPSLLVVGGHQAEAVRRVAALYSPLEVSPCMVTLRTAEMIKYACNAFHAVKIAFANEIGALAVSLNTDPNEVMGTLVKDVKLNSSAAYLKPGFAFGGSCLPKDLRAINYRAARLDIDLPLLASALPSNQSHLDRALQALLALPSQRTGFIGLAFKEDTDDVRESPVVFLLEQLTGKGRDTRVFDPHIRLDDLYGSNRNFIFKTLPHIGRLMDGSLDKMLDWADHLVLVQKQSAAIMERIRQSGLPVLDLVNTVPGRVV